MTIPPLMPASAPPSRAAFILAGGKSSRMGVDKASLEFRGQTLLDRAITTAREVCDQVSILANPSQLNPAKHLFPRQTLRTIADIFPNCGPLGGIHAALLDSTADVNLMLAVDMPFVTPSLLEFLFAGAAEHDAIVTVPRTTRGLQPLCAIYRREFAVVAEKQLRAGKYKIDAAFAAMATHVIEPEELATAGFSEDLFANLNTPRDLQTAENR